MEAPANNPSYRDDYIPYEGLQTLFFLSLAGGLITGAVIAIRWLFKQAIVFWEIFPQASSSLLGASVMAGTVAVTGGLLYCLRERARFIYAALEFAVAIAVAIESCLRIGPTSSKGALGCALLGSIYIVVRAIDNFSKAKKDRVEKESKLKIKSNAKE